MGVAARDLIIIIIRCAPRTVFFGDSSVRASATTLPPSAHPPPPLDPRMYPRLPSRKLHQAQNGNPIQSAVRLLGHLISEQKLSPG